MLDTSDYTAGDIEELERWVDESREQLFELLVTGLEQQLLNAREMGLYSEAMLVEQEEYCRESASKFAEFDREISSARAKGPPWELWKETFGRYPTPGLLLVERTMANSGAHYPCFGHHYYELSRLLAHSTLTFHFEHNKEVLQLKQVARGACETFDVAYDYSARAHFRALLAHPNVDEDKYRPFLSKLVFQSDAEWDAYFDEAMSAAESAKESDVLERSFLFASSLLKLTPEESREMHAEVERRQAEEDLNASDADAS
ncbi:MAG: hypothetical protein ACI9KE_000266 [Polyangiales bacterium]|jgi:hypothetical protein